jgi:hexosaminidase
MIKAAKMGYQTVLSQGYYIDLMHPASKHYLNDPLEKNNALTIEESKNILGGEATMWSELVTPLTIDSRIWPRTAAIAERLWSQQAIDDVDNMYKRLEIISFQLESLGITHIKNKEVILRNITDNHDVNALIDLMNVCEPLKGYTRNHKGTEYKSFSPFTLFADACTADAPDARKFNKNTELFLKEDDLNALKMLKRDLSKWSGNYSRLQQIPVNPKIKPLLPLSIGLSDISTQILAAFNQKKITKEHLSKAYKILKELKKPHADVDLMLVKSLRQLLIYCEKHYL